MNKLIKILTTILLFINLNCFGWGAVGHKIVADIAKSFLKKSVLDSVQYYLGKTTFQEASVWMDEIKSQPEYDFLKPLHYVNVQKDKTYVANTEPNIINELQSVLTILFDKKHRNKYEINCALKIAFHLIGDLHQPLHNGYAEDKGGNAINVSFLENNNNLHRVWDSGIIENQKITLEDCLKLNKSYSRKERRTLKKIEPVVWMENSRLLLKDVYNFSDNKIDSNYINKNSVNVKKQLLIAGIRLASVLNKSFTK